MENDGTFQGVGKLRTFQKVRARASMRSPHGAARAAPSSKQMKRTKAGRKGARGAAAGPAAMGASSTKLP